MQFIEVTGMAGVRSAVLTFRRQGGPLTFVLYPMIHLAEPGFYAEVQARLRASDLVIAEGGAGRSIRIRALTRSYRWAEGNRRLGLVVQHIDYKSLAVPVVYPDMSGAELDHQWQQRIPLLTRAGVVLLATIFAVGMRMFGRRRFIARHLGSLDDLSALDNRALTADSRWEAVDELIVDARDRLLVDAVKSIHDRQQHEPAHIAVVYGADHMVAVVQGLYLLGYRPSKAEWLTAFTLIDDL